MDLSEEVLVFHLSGTDERKLWTIICYTQSLTSSLSSVTNVVVTFTKLLLNTQVVTLCLIVVT